MYIKDGKIESGYCLRKADGCLSFNAPEEDWLAEGWQKYEPGQEEADLEPVNNLWTVKSNVLQECREYFVDQILKFKFGLGDDLVWMPLKERAETRQYIQSLPPGTETAVFMERELPISKISEILDSVDTYENEARKIHLKHKQIIEKINSVSELEDYDYTLSYPHMLKF